MRLLRSGENWFSDIERSAIQNNMMLSDESINIAQRMLADQFPDCCGLSDTTIGPTNLENHNIKPPL